MNIKNLIIATLCSRKTVKIIWSNEEIIYFKKKDSVNIWKLDIKEFIANMRSRLKNNKILNFENLESSMERLECTYSIFEREKLYIFFDSYNVFVNYKNRTKKIKELENKQRDFGVINEKIFFIQTMGTGNYFLCTLKDLALKNEPEFKEFESKVYLDNISFGYSDFQNKTVFLKEKNYYILDENLNTLFKVDTEQHNIINNKNEIIFKPKKDYKLINVINLKTVTDFNISKNDNFKCDFKLFNSENNLHFIYYNGKKTTIVVKINNDETINEFKHNCSNLRIDSDYNFCTSTKIKSYTIKTKRNSYFLNQPYKAGINVDILKDPFSDSQGYYKFSSKKIVLFEEDGKISMFGKEMYIDNKNIDFIIKLYNNNFRFYFDYCTLKFIAIKEKNLMVFDMDLNFLSSIESTSYFDINLKLFKKVKKISEMSTEEEIKKMKLKILMKKEF